MKKIKVLELFGGIGACAEAMKQLGMNYEIIDYVEIDKYAVKSYNAMNGTDFEPQDITKWDKDVSADLIMQGSPCQNFSICGNQTGGDENSGTQSSLMYETLRIIEKIKPRYVIWENVKNILSDKHVHNFNNYLERMQQLGYKNHYKIFLASDYGIPQARERVFVISTLEDKYIELPSGQITDRTLMEFLEENIEEKYFYTKEKYPKMFTEKGLNLEREITRTDISYQLRRNSYIRENKSGLCPTLTANMGGGGNNVPIIKTENGIRKLTPKECLRLMGFSDTSIEKMLPVNSDTQLYKQAGNSICVPILKAILKSIFNL